MATKTPKTPRATTIEQYLSGLTDARREAVSAIRATINDRLPDGYEEGIQYGMIGWYVPHSICPDGYHCDPKQPVPFVSVASQKKHIGIYLFCVYVDTDVHARFVADWQATGKLLDMGKGCVRVRKLDETPLEVIGDAIASMPVDKFLAVYEASVPESAKKKRGRGRG